MPESDPLRLYKELTPLRHVKRFQQYACIAPISVAEHSYYVALLAGGFAAQLQALGVYVNRPAVIEGALWHDAAEALTGDLPHPVTREFPELGAAWKTVEEHLENVLRSMSPATLKLDGFFQLEKALIKLADWTELVLYVHEERWAGNRSIDTPQHVILNALRGPLWEVFGRFPVKVSGWYLDTIAEVERVAFLAEEIPADRLCFLGALKK